jgi:hypothetical protein
MHAAQEITEILSNLEILSLAVGSMAASLHDVAALQMLLK